MGVLKNLQNLSDLEFYKCAEKLQDDITDFCLRNFGLKKSPRNVNQIIKDISEEDQSEINKIFEKYGKTRHIKSLHISDRVLQRALCDYILAPATERYLIYDNAASVKGKGIEFSRKRLQAHLERYYRQYGREGYVLQIDFSKYFDNIRHDVVIEQYKSWRGNIIKYKTYKSVRNLDALYKSLIGENYGRNGKKNGARTQGKRNSNAD